MSSGRGLCDELITRPEESYRLWCVVVCDLENLKNEEATSRFGSQRHNKKKILIRGNISFIHRREPQIAHIRELYSHLNFGLFSLHFLSYD